MSNKKIIIILIILVLLPALFYTFNEMSAMDENEQVLSEIYNQKLNSILFSVNQYYWDKANKLRSDFSILLKNSNNTFDQNIEGFVERTSGLQGVLLSDSLVQYPSFYITQYYKEKISLANLDTALQNREQLIKRLLYRQRVGYSKSEGFVFNGLKGEPYLVLLFALQDSNTKGRVAGLFFELGVFAYETLREKIVEFDNLEVVLGLFEKNKQQPLISSGDILLSDARLVKNLWLFPNHVLGIRSQDGVDIEEAIQGRFRRSLILIVLLDIILLIAAYILYRAIRKEMQLARMKSDFVSNVSHELRTPLALIRMFSETLEMQRVKSEDKKQEYYRIINQETIRLTHLINNILDFSKIEADKKQFRFASINLNQVVNSCMDFYKFHLENNGFKYSLQLSSKELSIQADEDAITEVLINLLENAIKYSKEVKEVTVKTGADSEWAFVEIADKGIGIAEKDKKLIFEKFYRGTDGLVHNTKGSGLGLSLVDFAVKAHGGKIELESAVGKGSRFRLLFPLNKS